MLFNLIITMPWEAIQYLLHLTAYDVSRPSLTFASDVCHGWKLDDTDWKQM